MQLRNKPCNSGLHFDIASIKSEIDELEVISGSPDFWNDSKNALEIINRLNEKKDIYKCYCKIINDCRDLKELIDLQDSSLYESIEESFIIVKKEADEFQINILFTDKNDNLNALVDIHPGAGGTEAQDWAEMLLRMYARFCEINHLKYEVMDYLPGEEAGLKSVTIRIKGKHAYGLLKSEKGVHRLVRISPFDANKRRHTSFASVNVVPEFKDVEEVKINETDLKIDTYHSQGAGGQNVNKTESAVRITHIPTGIVVSCQVERSQMSNKETALNMLKSRLMQIEFEKRNNELKNIVGEQKNIEWGSQIRSYVFCPYTLVKDNRSGYEATDINKVMDGDIIDFIFAYLKKEAAKNVK